MNFSGEEAGFLKKNALPALLCLLVLAVLFPALNNGFVDWDDMQYVVSNRALRGSWTEILTFFSGYYQPLTILTYKIEFVLFGLNPLPYHLTSLALHIVNCVSVFFLFKMLGARPGSAFLGALLFGVHPAHVEPAAWVSGRKELLWGMFSFWALIAYLRSINSGGRKLTFYSLLFFALAILSKPSALVFPFLLLLADHYRGRAFSARLLAEKAPYLLIAAIGFLLSSSPSGFLLRGAGGEFHLLSAAASAAQSALFYAGKFAAPRALSALYPPLALPLSPAVYLLALLSAAAALYGLVALSRRGETPENEDPAGIPGPGGFKKAVFGLGFFLVAALPCLVLSPPADRYSYVPAAGLCFLYGEFIFWLGSTAQARLRAGALQFARGGLAALVAVHLLLLSGAAFHRASVWKDSVALWGDVMKKNPLEPMAYYGRGNARRAAEDYAGAAADFTRCIELNPGYWKALANRARTYTEMKRFDEAIADYGKALELSPAEVQLFLNRGNAYFLKGEFPAAVKDYDRALALAPGMPQAAENRRIALLKRPAGRGIR